MNKKSKYKSNAFEAIHKSASALLKVRAIDKTTMRDFDKSCFITTPEIDLAQIKGVRKNPLFWMHFK